MDTFTALAPLRDGYVTLFDHLRQLAERDDRVRALWLHGSVAKGLADRESDLDVILTLSDESLAAFSAELTSWIDRVDALVFTKVLFGRVVIALTSDLRRIDLVVETVSDLPRASDRHRVLVFEKEPLATALPAPDQPRRPDPTLVDTLVKDFIGELAAMTAVVGRQDWLFGLESVHRSRTMLHQILVEGNRPLPPHAAKQWSAQLTADQRPAFAGLPGVTATGDSVTEAKWATVQLFYMLVPDIAAALGVSWPTDLERAVRQLLRSELAYTLPSSFRGDD